MKKHISLLLLGFLVLLFGVYAPATQAQALETAQEAPHVKIRLLPERGIIEPGEAFWIGIEQSIDPHWHTYWRNPGDSGSAPRISWDLPEGFTVSEINWPVPSKIAYPPLLNYGYEDQVILLQKLTAPETLPDGPLTLKADIEILVCKEECIPEYGTYTLSLNDSGRLKDNNQAYLEAALEKLPGAAEENTDWTVFYNEENGDFLLYLTLLQDNVLKNAAPESITFFPHDWGLVDNPAPVFIKANQDTLILSQKRGDRPLAEIEGFSGVLTFTTADGQQNALTFTAQKAGSATAITQTTATHSTLAQAFFFALLGGLILNLMPCVFPVLSIKALSLVKIAEKHPEQARIHGLSYTAGVVLSFIAVAGILIALKTAGAQIGWGFQLQNPVVVSLLAYLLFIIGLNLSGLFDFGGGALANLGGKLTGGGKGHGYSNSFFTGVLATLVATPCTAPFMAAAIGFALLQPAFISLSIFAALGFGLALPYLMLSFMPGLQHILPKPGAWMNTFKKLLALPMYASAAWLVWVLSLQASMMGAVSVMLGMVALTIGLWLLTHKAEQPLRRYIATALAVLSFMFAVILIPAPRAAMPITSTDSALSKHAFGEPFSHETLSAALKTPDPVFVEMTAAWCITCKVNHATSINTDATKAIFAKHNVRFLVGDWTNQDEQITQYLQRYGRSGVPLYVYYAAPDENGVRPEPAVLPQILTPSIVADVVEP